MNKELIKEACMKNLAAIRLEKKKVIEDLWNIEWRESKLIEKMRRHNFWKNEEDKEDIKMSDDILSNDLH